MCPCAKEGLKEGLPIPAATDKQQLGRPSATTLSQASLPLSALPEARLHAALSPENPAPRAPPPSPARQRCCCLLYSPGLPSGATLSCSATSSEFCLPGVQSVYRWILAEHRSSVLFQVTLE